MKIIDVKLMTIMDGMPNIYKNGCSNLIQCMVVTYAQFDSNIHVLYVFLGFLKNTWKYLIQRPISKPLYHYNAF
jgi:hypothetical protein